MPGVIMDHGSRNGSHTNHDRDQRHNGINGVIHTSETQDKGKGRAEPQQNMTPISPTMPNGINGNLLQDSQVANGAGNGSPQNRIGELPPEILHITEGYMPLAGLLQRLAQHTHSGLKDVLTELSQMPLPASVLNGSLSHISSADDNSAENVAKKKKLLDFAMNTHESWTKALVITGWSRKADEVSRAVDIRMHEKQASDLYRYAIDDLANKKREFSAHKREPNPDLRTAVPVLTTGKAHWMPDLGYIPPPPLTSKEVLQSLERLNTLLSVRLNLDDYDTIPLQFKEFTISSGRATFRVDGEFELDVTIADEDPQSQFWFIDCRFIFWPSAPTLAPRVRVFIENKVNEILLKDGLSGCYKFLHEMILTYKIAEFRRQATDLGRAKWVETLKVEALNRALSVQYWLERFNGLGAKSWILLGVHSGKREDGRPDAKSTSRLFLRWFRDHKEVKDVDITFDDVKISMEALLKVVIARHISHILTDIFERFSAMPLYANRELSLSLATSTDDPSKPELNIQLTNERHVCLKVDPISGRFAFSPTILVLHKWEAALNTPSRDLKDSTGKKIEGAADKATRILENLRYSFISDDINTRGVTLGWRRLQDPGIRRNVLFEAIPKTTSMYLWLRRAAWADDWYLLLCASMSGVTWVLIKLKKQPTPLDPRPNALGVGACLMMPINSISPTIDYTFLTTLTTFTSGLLSQYVNLKALHARRVHQLLHHGKPSKALTIPPIFIRISELLAENPTSTGPKSMWAKDIIKLTFQGIELRAPCFPSASSPDGSSKSMAHRGQDENAVLVTQARMIVPLPKDLTNLNSKVDPDIAFNSGTGSFAFRLRSEVGQSVIPSLIERIFSIERLVECVQVLQKHENTLKCESVSLGKIVFIYSHTPSAASDKESSARQLPHYRATVDFRTRDNKMTLLFEKGNPHLRILDYLNSVLNTEEGLDGVAKFLALTLPVLRGLNAIEDAWNDSALSDKGEVIINARAADWYIIRYGLRQGVQDPESPPRMRKVQFEVRLRGRRGVPWWYVHRTDNQRSKEFDNLDAAFKPLWASTGTDWKGMRSTGVAQNNGAEEILVKMDEVIRTFTMSGVDIQVQPVAETSAQAPKQAPSRQQYQQPRQQPTPNQSQNQSQSQGRGPLKREYVEID